MSNIARTFRKFEGNVSREYEPIGESIEFNGRMEHHSSEIRSIYMTANEHVFTDKQDVLDYLKGN